MHVFGDWQCPYLSWINIPSNEASTYMHGESFVCLVDYARHKCVLKLADIGTHQIRGGWVVFEGPKRVDYDSRLAVLFCVFLMILSAY